MIELTEVKKSFEDIKVLNNVSLTVKKGSIYGLLGSNGAGKTTLLKTIAGIYRQNSGSIHIDNEEVFENAVGGAPGNAFCNDPGTFSGRLRTADQMRKKHRYRHGNRDLPDRLRDRKFSDCNERKNR